LSAVLLALCAGLLFAIAAGLQRAAACATLAATARPPRRVTSFLPITGALARLVRNRLWLIGWGVNAVGFLIQAIALHRGSVALVQPVLVTQLLFTIPVAVVGTGRRPAGADWIAGLSVCLGIIVFVDVWGTAAVRRGPSGGILVAVLAAWAGALILVAVASRVRAARRVLFTSAAAGLCFASSAVLMKVTIDPLVRDGLGVALSHYPVYLLFISTTLGLVIGQDALASGSLPTAVAGMAITNPLASAAIGVFAFGERVPFHVSTMVGLATALILLTGGVLALAQSPTLRGAQPVAGAASAGEPVVGRRVRSRGLRPNIPLGGDAEHVPSGTMGSMVPSEQAHT
jgi:drug/metabolite transporter (DMT)-like permease